MITFVQIIETLVGLGLFALLAIGCWIYYEEWAFRAYCRALEQGHEQHLYDAYDEALAGRLPYNEAFEVDEDAQRAAQVAARDALDRGVRIPLHELAKNFPQLKLELERAARLPEARLPQGFDETGYREDYL